MKRSTVAILIVAAVAIVVVAAVAAFSANLLRTPADQPGTRPIASDAAVLFESNRDTGSRRKEIYAMDADGGNVTRITFSKMHHFLVGIDPSRRYLIVTRADQDTDPPLGLGDEDRRSLWVIDTVTGNETRLTAPENQAEGDSVSSDGQWIVFHMQLAGNTQTDLYKIRLDGTDLTRLTFTKDANECDPAWSPDNKKIAYTCFSTNTPRFVLMIRDVDGSNERIVHDPIDAVNTTLFPPGAYDPSWSPDSEWITFEKPVHFAEENGGAGIWHIFKIHPDGSGLTDLSEAGGHTDWAEYLPSFSEDGRLILFSVRTGPADASETHIDVYVMDSDGGSLKRLTDTAAVEDCAIWIGR